jgi:ferritin heavy chain
MLTYADVCWQALNDHINVEYTASYAYHALFSYFDRDTVGLPGTRLLTPTSEATSV